ETAFALHGLQDERRHAFGLDVVLEEQLYRVQCIVHAHAVQRVRVQRVEHLPREGAETELVGGNLAGQPQRQQGAAVVATGEGDDAGPVGGGPRDLDSVLDG